MGSYAEWFAKRLRDVLGDMPQTELITIMKGNGVEIKAGRLSHYMQGRNYPDPDVLAAIAKAFGVSTDYLVGLTDDKRPVDELREQLAIAKGKSKVDNILEILDKDQRAQVLAYAEFLATQGSATSERQDRKEDALEMLRLIDATLGEPARKAIERAMYTSGLFGVDNSSDGDDS